MLGPLNQKDLFYITDLLKHRKKDVEVLRLREKRLIRNLKSHYDNELKENIKIIETIDRYL